MVPAPAAEKKSRPEEGAEPAVPDHHESTSPSQPAEAAELRSPSAADSAQAALASASLWARRVVSASNARITELRESLAEAKAARVVPAQRVDTVTFDRPTLGRAAEKHNVRRSPAPESAATMLSISGLTKRFDDTIAVAGIDLRIAAGEFYGIVGPNGAGKTTTLSMITGLLRPDSGTVMVRGIDMWSDPVRAKKIMGVLPDRLRLFDRLTGSQLLYYAGVLRGLNNAVARERATGLLRAFGLDDVAGRLVSDYSAGMTKKIALAMAMIHSPRLLVLDEPFESVDPVSAASVINILKKYAAAGGTVLLSSHSMDLVQRICDHVAVIAHGEILADGTMDFVRQGRTLDDRFAQLVGGADSAEELTWLNNFSD
ncbi:MAG: ABC transporter ATP-binding protein [Rhodoglobus sp.]